jgi:ParB family transcriptional regulator, chromosome partitioning protein
MSIKHGLGKGMMALVDENELKIEDSGNGTSVDIHKILPNRYQPRKRFSEESLKELAESIREKGVIQPVIVTEIGDGRYELVAGERRLRAAKLAGLMDMPVIIKNYSEEDKLEIALIENIQREDLNAVEQAMSFKEIMERLNLNQDEFAKKIGKDRSSVANTLRLLKLPEYVREKIETGEISEGHARAILSLGGIDRMIHLTNTIIEKGLSVREAEMAAKENAEPKKGVSRETKRRKDGKLGEIQEKFVKAVGAKVEIKGTEKKGKIEISYFSKQELENIYRHISHKGSSRN